jgi:hypothetical protein
MGCEIRLFAPHPPKCKVASFRVNYALKWPEGVLRAYLDDAFERLDGCAADPELITLAKHCLELEPAKGPFPVSKSRAAYGGEQ